MGKAGVSSIFPVGIEHDIFYGWAEVVAGEDRTKFLFPDFVQMGSFSMSEVRNDRDFRRFSVEIDGRIRLDRWLSDQIDGVSRSRLQKAIREGQVLVDGKEVSPREMLVCGRMVEVRGDVLLPEKEEVRPPVPQPLHLEILYEDDELLVLNKSAGMVVHPGNGCADGTVVNAALSHCGSLPVLGELDRPGVVHRLDKETTGVLVLAKTEEAGRELMRQFHDRETRKFYLAVVQGWGIDESGVCDGRIGRDANRRTRMAVIEEGREALSRWEVIHRSVDENWALVRVGIETGRTHQIRVHLSHAGYPIIGDQLYGYRKNRSKGKACFAPRILLHAAELELTHPENGERKIFRAPLPVEMRPFSGE